MEELLPLLLGLSKGGGAGAAVSAIPAALQLSMGVWQMLKGNKMNVQRPQMEIPEAATQALKLKQMVASQTQLPAQSAIEEKFKVNTSSNMGALLSGTTNPATLTAAASGLNAATQDRTRDLGISAAQQYNAAQYNLASAQDKYAAWQDKQFTWNKIGKYEEDAATKAALTGSGMQNIFGATKTGAETVTAGMEHNKNMDFLMNFLASYSKMNNPQLTQQPQQPGGGNYPMLQQPQQIMGGNYPVLQAAPQINGAEFPQNNNYMNGFYQW